VTVSLTEQAIADSFKRLKGRKGTYALLVQVNQSIRINIGKLGQHRFVPGIYIYAGSAMGTTSTSLGHRLRRHFSKSKKKHWHVDYLLSDPGTRVLGALWAESKKSVECGLASALRDSHVFEAGPAGFGASDCRAGCGTHLFRYAGNDGLGSIRVAIQRELQDFGALNFLQNW